MMSEPTQSEIPIPAEAIEAAAKATVEGGPNERRGDWEGLSGREREAWLEGTEAAIRAALSEMRFEVEQPVMTPTVVDRTVYRLVSAWLPVALGNGGQR